MERKLFLALVKFFHSPLPTCSVTLFVQSALSSSPTVFKVSKEIDDLLTLLKSIIYSWDKKEFTKLSILSFCMIKVSLCSVAES